MRIILLLMAVMLMAGAEARYSPGLEIAEGENVTLNGGWLLNSQLEYQFNPEAYGATGDDYTDDAEAIQDCIDAAYAFYLDTLIEPTVEFPPGLFFANSSQTHYDNYGILIEPRPHIKYRGAGIGKTILRAKDNYRNASVGCYLFWNEDEYLPNFQLSDMTFDYGNNTVQVGEVNNTAIGAAWTSDVVVHDVEFSNVSGTWALKLGFSGTHRGDCVGAIAYNIYVNDVAQSLYGDATHDHTSVRFDMDNVVFSNSILKNTNHTTNAAGFEFHGNNSMANLIQVKNYDWGGNVGADQFSVSTSYNQVIQNSIFETDSGIGLWSLPAGSVLQSVLISNNKFRITEDNSAKVGSSVSTGTVTGDVNNVTIIGNMIENVGGGANVPSSGAYLSQIDSLIFENNVVRNCTTGIKIESTEDISNYLIAKNDIIDWGRGVANGQHTAGIYVDVRPTVYGGSCTIRDNNLLGDGYPKYGILTYTPVLKYLTIEDNYVEDTNTADIYTFYPVGYTNESIYIRHTCRTRAPSGSYQWAIDGSTWENLAGKKSYRKSTTWKYITWTLT